MFYNKQKKVGYSSPTFLLKIIHPIAQQPDGTLCFHHLNEG